jgi:hypothetical protein
MSSARREVDQLIRELRSAGFSVKRTGSGHWMVRPAAGEGCVVLAFSPKIANLHKTRARLRSIGYDPQG